MHFFLLLLLSNKTLLTKIENLATKMYLGLFEFPLLIFTSPPHHYLSHDRDYLKLI